MLAGVLLPWSLLEWRGERRRWWTGEGRPVLVVALLGLAGIFQFILIHAEPRLIAPYGMLLALAVLSRGSEAPAGRVLQRAAALLGVVLVAWYGWDKVREGMDTGPRLEQIVAKMDATNAELAANGFSQRRIVVLGAGIPVSSGAFLSGARIVAQLLPASAALLDSLPPDERHAVLGRLFGGRVQVAWRSAADGTVSYVGVPPR